MDLNQTDNNDMIVSMQMNISSSYHLNNPFNPEGELWFSNFGSKERNLTFPLMVILFLCWLVEFLTVVKEDNRLAD